MKKKLGLMLLIFLTFFLSSCGAKAIPAEEVAELFVNRLVYKKDNEKFVKSFRDGEQVASELDKIGEDFETNFVNSLSSTGVEISKKQASALTNELLKQVKEKAEYKVVTIDETKNGATITYFVTGLDLVNTMLDMTRQLIKDALDNPEIAQSEQKTLDATLSILEDRVKTIKISSDPVELKLKLEKEKGQWLIPADQKEAVSNLYMAFISGTKDMKEMNKELTDGLNRVIEEVSGKLADEPNAGKN